MRRQLTALRADTTEASPSASQQPATPLRQWDIFVFWLPLFASWLLMCAEGPLLSAVVNRLPNEVVMLAAFGIAMTLAITIESPVINLLATATALVKSRASYELVRRFTLHWIVLLTAVSILIAFTPVFDLVVRGLLDVPPEVATWVRPGLQILTLWTAAIAWRRFLQGVLIRFNQTRKVGRGTFLRLIATAGTAFTLLSSTDWPGVYIAATSLMAGVTTEALYATLTIRPILRRELCPQPSDANDTLTYRDLLQFHMPLAGTAALALFAQPMVTFALARLPQPTLTLAVWPLIFHATLVMRAAAFSLPEAVIALNRGPETQAPIRRFSWTLAGMALLSVALFTWTPLAGFYLSDLQDATPEVAATARRGLMLFLFFPALATLVAWLNGLLIGAGRTRAVNEGMAIYVLFIALFLGPAILFEGSGITAAAVALTAATLAQFLYLTWRQSSPRRAKTPLAAAATP